MQGYVGTGLKNINTGSDIRQQLLQQQLASRGLSFSPMAANAQTQLQGERVGAGVNFMNTVPLLQRQFQTEDIENLMKFFQGLPTGSSTTGSRTGTSSTSTNEKTTAPGNMLGGLFTGAAAPFATYLGGLIKQPTKP